MKITFNKKIIKGPWGGGNQILLLLYGYFKRRKHNVCFSLDDDSDVIVLMDVKDESCSFSLKELSEFKKRHNIRVVHRVNDNGTHRKQDKSRNNESMIEANKLYADDTVFISNWLRDYYVQEGMGVKNSVVIPNGTDRGLFFPIVGLEPRKEKEPLKIVTHHWSSNEAKGYKTYEKLSNFCHSNPNIASFRFLGNAPPDTLEKAKKIESKPYQQIPPYLQDQDIYVTATQFESGGCHLIEGMACGLIPLVKRGGGGTEEYAQGYGAIYDDAEELISCIVSLYEDYDRFMSLRNDIRTKYTYGSKDMCQKYYEVISNAK